jgi:aspartate-semialdehyde dehydrogenase
MSSVLKVGIVGATGAVGQRFVALLMGEGGNCSAGRWALVAVGASNRSCGATYAAATNWVLETPMPAAVRDMVVVDCSAAAMGACDVVFSALDASVAGDVELALAGAGVLVFSNAKNYRMERDVPILLPLVNAAHLALLRHQRRVRGWTTGGIVCNANCSTTGLATALAPLAARFGLERVSVVTLQAISGAGYPGVAALDITANVLPFISGEEEKLAIESNKILGSLAAAGDAIEFASFGVSATCTRVPVVDGHMLCVTVQLAREARSLDEVLSAWSEHATPPGLASAPQHAIEVLDGPHPQPRRDVLRGNGYTVSIGRVRLDRFGLHFVALVHNTILGAAGGSILNAELAIRDGFVSVKK